MNLSLIFLFYLAAVTFAEDLAAPEANGNTPNVDQPKSKSGKKVSLI
jgi:hypothetical protein